MIRSRSNVCIGLSVLLASTSLASTKCNLHAATAPSAQECARQWIDENLRLNDVMTVGTHNSYKQAIPETELAVIRARSPKGAMSLDYSHRPLAEQLDAGARQIELDVYYDPDGGRFANPIGPKMAGAGIDQITADEWARPGFKVMHVPDIDVRSSCASFVTCLRIVRNWSKVHPQHTPLLILINAKEDKSPAPGGVSALLFDTQVFDALDAEIGSVFSVRELITPDQVRGKHMTLREGVLAGNWPKLQAARGKILFALDDSPRIVALYQGERRSLEGRLMFANTHEASPAAAYLTLNEPVAQSDRIRAAVQAGFIVRTRADADTVEARSGSVVRKDAAFNSGAQYVSTDYMQPDSRFGPYSVQLPAGAVAICNSVRTKDRCAGHAIE